MISFKVVEKVWEQRSINEQRSEVHIDVEQTQSLFDRLGEEIAPSQYWTSWHVEEDGITVFGWRLITPSGCRYPVQGCKAMLDEYFQKLFTRWDHPAVKIRLRHTDQRRRVA